MAYSSIPDSKREVGKPIDKDLVDTIHYNLEDLNTRLASISIAAGSAILLNTLEKKPKDSLPIGSIVHGSLTGTQFTAETDGGEWVLADGASASGSDWATLTGRTTLPDARGRFLRGKANGSGNSPVDPTLDTYTADSIVSHLHDMGHGHSNTFSASNSAVSDHFHAMVASGTSPDDIGTTNGLGVVRNTITDRFTTSGGIADYVLKATTGSPTLGLSGAAGAHNHTITMSGSVTNMAGNTGSTGATETAPKYVTENIFIKINRAYIGTNTRLFAIRVPQQTILNNILLSPVSQGTSGSLTIDIKKGNTIATATQSIFQSGQLPTLAFNGSSGVTGLTDSAQNTVAAGQFIVVSITATQAKLREFHLFIGGDY